VAREAAWGLVGELTGASGAVDGPTVVLNAHVDVVPSGDDRLWTTPAFHPRRDAAPDGRDALYGRGACDMKGGLVAVLATLDSLRHRGLPRRGRVLVQCVVGEEDGGLGTFATLARGHVGDVAVIPEATSNQIVCANAGALTFAVSIPGRSAHGSSRRDGVSAIAQLWPVWQAIEELEARRHTDVHPLMSHLDTPYGISIGTVRAGDWASNVPDLLVAEGRLGVALGEDTEHARDDLREAVAGACAASPWLCDNPATVEFTGGQFASGMTDPGDPLVSVLSAAHAGRTGQVPAVQGAPYGSDLRLLTSLGIPTVHYGPGSIRQAHSPDEYVALADVALTARVLTDVVEHYCA
jgi:acetylornithine deacetylase